MSKELELQPIISNGRHSTSPPAADNMSGTGSFTTPSPHDVSTDVVGPITPVYASVPEAQAAHGRYTAQQVKPAGYSGAVPGQTSEYTSPTGTDPPNTYDMIPGDNGQRKERSHSPMGRPLMADNVLYGTPADEMKHRTLTMEKAAAEGGQHLNHQTRFSGSVSSQMLKEPGEGGSPFFTGRCCGVCLMLVLVFVVAFLAVAALVLVLSVMFQIFPVCNCPTTQDVQDLRSEVEMLRSMLPTTTQQPTGTPVPDDLSARVDDLQIRITALENSDSSNSLQLGTNYTSVLGGFNLFDNCTTVGVINCAGAGSCETFGNTTPLNVPGTFTMGARCVRELGAATDMSATLEINETENQAICVCSSPLGRGVNCTLQITRCPVPQIITAEFVVSNSP